MADAPDRTPARPLPTVAEGTAPRRPVAIDVALPQQRSEARMAGVVASLRDAPATLHDVEPLIHPPNATRFWSWSSRSRRTATWDSTNPAS